MVPVCFSRTNASTDMQYDLLYKWPHVILTWGQILTLTLQGHNVPTYVDASWRQDHDAAKIMSLAFLVHSYLQGTIFANAILTYWPLQPSPLKLGKFWRHASERALKGLSNTFFRGLLPIIGSEIMAHFRKNNIELRQIWPLVTSGNINIDLSEKKTTETISNVLIQSNRTLFSAPFYPS